MTKQMTSKFPGKCSTCGTRFPSGTPIVWTKGAGAVHADQDTCTAAKAAAAARATRPAVTADGAPIAAFLLSAKERGLKFPTAAFLAPGGGELRLSVAGPTSKAPGSIQVKIATDGEVNWIGRIEPSGVVAGPLEDNAAILQTLTIIASDPAKAAAEYGRLTGRCSFCNSPLSDDRSGSSVEVGYGPVCAKRYGLPHHPTGPRHDLKPIDDAPLAATR